MTDVDFYLCEVASPQGQFIPIEDPATLLGNETIASTSSNQVSTMMAPASVSLRPAVWCVTAGMLGDVYVAVAAVPNALTGTTTRRKVTAGTTKWLRAIEGHKIAVVDA